MSDIRKALESATRPNGDFDIGEYMDWYFKVRGAALAEPEWQTIDSAPKDHSILLYAESALGEYMAVGQWSDNDQLPGTVEGWFWPFAIRPTHWRLLPSPQGGSREAE